MKIKILSAILIAFLGLLSLGALKKDTAPTTIEFEYGPTARIYIIEKDGLEFAVAHSSYGLSICQINRNSDVPKNIWENAYKQAKERGAADEVARDFANKVILAISIK